jgi:hypothetical protein
MMTLNEVEARTDNILLRIGSLCDELKSASNNSPEVNALTEELETLLREYTTIFASLQSIQEISERLYNEACSGPH